MKKVFETISAFMLNKINPARRKEIETLVKVGNETDVICSLDAATDITRHSLKRMLHLAGEGWWNDEGMNAFFTHLQLLLQDMGKSKTKSIGSSFFLTQTRSSGIFNESAFTYLGIGDEGAWWEKRSIYLGCNNPRSHWALAEVRPKEGKILFYDTCKTQKFAGECFTILQTWFREVAFSQWERAKRRQPGAHYKPSKRKNLCPIPPDQTEAMLEARCHEVLTWKLEIVNVKQQENGSDCGACCCLLLLYLIMGLELADIDLKVSSVREFRFKAVNVLLRQGFVLD
jgi:Ulp1 family protease